MKSLTESADSCTNMLQRLIALTFVQLLADSEKLGVERWRARHKEAEANWAKNLTPFSRFA